jgi:hypothetical protein
LLPWGSKYTSRRVKAGASMMAAMRCETLSTCPRLDQVNPSRKNHLIRQVSPNFSSSSMAVYLGQSLPRPRFDIGWVSSFPGLSSQILVATLPFWQSPSKLTKPCRFQVSFRAKKAVLAGPVSRCLHVNVRTRCPRTESLTLVQIRDGLIDLVPSWTKCIGNGELFQSTKLFVNGRPRSFPILDGQCTGQGIEKEVACIAAVQSTKGFAHAGIVTENVT